MQQGNPVRLKTGPAPVSSTTTEPSPSSSSASASSAAGPPSTSSAGHISLSTSSAEPSTLSSPISTGLLADSVDSSESDSEEFSIFDNEAAQTSFDDFMISLPKLVRKTLAVSLMFYFHARQSKTVKAAALEAAYITGFNEKTVRQYRNEYFENKGQFSETKSGKYKRISILDDENLRLEAAMYVRENAHKKGSPNMTAASFCAWVNNDLLPSTTLPPNYPRLISVRTATRWLHKTGYRPTSH